MGLRKAIFFVKWVHCLSRSTEIDLEDAKGKLSRYIFLRLIIPIADGRYAVANPQWPPLCVAPVQRKVWGRFAVKKSGTARPRSAESAPCTHRLRAGISIRRNNLGRQAGVVLLLAVGYFNDQKKERRIYNMSGLRFRLTCCNVQD